MQVKVEHMKRSVIILILALVGLIFLFLVWANDPLSRKERGWLKHHGAVKVAYSNDYPPLNFEDQDGQARGICIDYWRLLAEKLGFEVEFLPSAQLSRQLEGLNSNRYDSITDLPLQERHSERFDFSRPFMNIKSYIFVKSHHNDAKDIKEMGDLKLGVVKGNAGQVWSESVGLKPKTYANYTDTILALVKGELDAIVMSEPVVGYLSAKYKLEDKIIRGVQVDQTKMAIPVKKNNQILLSILNKGVAAISPEELRRITIKWFAEGPICKECQRKFRTLMKGKIAG